MKDANQAFITAQLTSFLSGRPLQKCRRGYETGITIEILDTALSGTGTRFFLVKALI
ncbi:MAG: hypothetical protein Q8930_13660 [Bacillota bacterium]|nr:hypothetical protein [Bacillota bacterium]